MSKNEQIYYLTRSQLQGGELRSNVRRGVGFTAWLLHKATTAPAAAPTTSGHRGAKTESTYQEMK